MAASAMASPLSSSSCISSSSSPIDLSHASPQLPRISFHPFLKDIRRARFPFFVHASSTAVLDAPQAATSEKPLPRLKRIYVNNVVPAMKEEFKYSNTLQVPKVEKVVVNCGIGEASQNAKILENAMQDIATVSGQRPVITRAKKAIAGFKLRKGVPVGVAVTLRGELMYSFLDRLLNLVLPRTRDFLGVNPYSFDGKGNFNLGLKEQGVFPEIKFDNIDKPRGMDISIFTSAKTDKEGQKLLTLLGMPFRVGDTSARPLVKRKKVKFFGKGSKAQKAVAKKKKKKN